MIIFSSFTGDSLRLPRIARLADRLAGEAASVGDRMKSEGLRHDVIDRLSDRLSVNAAKCGKAIKRVLAGS